MSECQRQIEIESMEQFVSLFGNLDENVDILKQELGVNIFARGTELTVSGDEQAVDTAVSVVQKLLGMLTRGEPIDRSRIRYAISLAREGNIDRIEEIMQDVIAITYRGKQVKCKTLGQRQYVKSVKDNLMTFAVGPAGTGKTYLAIAMAFVALKNKEVERIILTRPAVEAGEKLGFLPGDLQEKIDPYLRPLYDGLYDTLGADAAQRHLEKGIIEIAPLAYMRGRTLDDAFIILDEAQNTTPEQMKMFLTRIGFGSKAVVTGDITQIDLPKASQSGLRQAYRILQNIEEIGFYNLQAEDVVRHPVVAKIIRAYDRFQARELSQHELRDKSYEPQEDTTVETV